MSSFMELLAYSQDALLRSNEANKIAARNQAFAVASANAQTQFQWYLTYLQTQQQQGYVGGD